jgi:hypothetical protein
MKNFKFLNTYLKQIQNKCISLLYFLCIQMIVANFYIKHIYCLAIVEFLLFLSLNSIIESMKFNYDLKFRVILKKILQGLQDVDLFESIDEHLQKKIKYLNAALCLLQGALVFVVIDIIYKFL